MKKNEIIYGLNNWRERYRSDQAHKRDTWIVCKLSNGSTIYLSEDYDLKLLKPFCKSNKFDIIDVGLRYRSHELWLEPEKCDGVYIVKSIKGYMNSKPTHCVVLGVIKGEVVEKKAYMTPELVISYEDTDKVENCFKEMLIYNDQKENGKK